MFKISQKIVVGLSLVCSTTFLASSAQAMGLSGTVADYGAPAPERAAGRHLQLTDTTISVNVENGEMVTFVVDGKSFTWNFDAFPNITNFALASIAPKGFDVKNVRVYLSENPLYRGG